MATKLVRLLSDGEFHSGSALGDALGVGRAAVWKQVRTLLARGVDIDAVRGRGYRLARPINLLTAGAVSSYLSPAASASVSSVDVRDFVDSTNTVAMAQIRLGHAKGYVCLAEQQGAGRGRRGRNWVSPYAENIYMSLNWTFDGGLPAIQGLSIAVGVAVCEAVESLGGKGVLLKWPNDVCYQGSKLAGVLIEVVGDFGGHCAVVIGIGLNVAMRHADADEIEQPWTDLTSLGCVIERNQVAGVLLSSLISMLAKFEKEGLPGMLSAWDRLDALKGRSIQVHVGGQVVDGLAAGIDTSGALILATTTGRLTFSAGEVSVRGWR